MDLFALKFCSPAFEILGDFVSVGLIGRDFRPQDPFKLLKLIKDPKLLFTWVKSVLAILEVKTKKLKLY